jgi:hypothetical protein
MVLLRGLLATCLLISGQVWPSTAAFPFLKQEEEFLAVQLCPGSTLDDLEKAAIAMKWGYELVKGMISTYCVPSDFARGLFQISST